MTDIEHDDLMQMLTRLKLSAVRDRFDTLLDEAARRDMSLRQALAYLCRTEIDHKNSRRISMALKLAKFPFDRTLEGFDYEAQPAVDPKQVEELRLCRWVANGDNLLMLGPQASARRTWRSPWDVRRFSADTPSASCKRRTCWLPW